MRTRSSRRRCPTFSTRAAPDVPYWPSTPTGGVLPFHVGEGSRHYYGIGAYRRPLDDVRLAGVKFTPECLGFSNVPEADNLRRLTPAGAVPPHHPAWKRGVPRDTGPGWDFEDVRDHYLEQLYQVDAVALRSDDLERYLALSRIVTGEVMEQVFAEWRRTDDACGGALTWFLNDLRPGAGWGLIDSDGRPKAVLHHLRRAWAPICVRLLDRGLDGLSAFAVNATGDRLDAVLETLVLAPGGRLLAEVRSSLLLEPRSSTETSIDRLLDRFADPTYSYRFGPLRHEAVVARLVTSDGEVLSEHVYRPRRASMTTVASVGARMRVAEHGGLSLELTSDSILYDVRIEVRDHLPDDDHFCLTPGRTRVVELRRVEDSGRAFQGYVEALNLSDAVRLDAPD